MKLGRMFVKNRQLGALDIDAGQRLTRRADAPLNGVLRPVERPENPRDALPQMYEDFFDAWESLHSPSGEQLSAEQIRQRKELAAQHLVGIAHLIRRARNGA